MRISLFIITFFTTLSIFAQENAIKNEVKDEINFDAVDSLYREDQFYLNITYNSLQKRIEGIQQNKLSPGIAFGFLRDMPINKNRTVSIAAGLGYSLAIYNQNLGISNANGVNTYEVLDSEITFSKNKQSFHYIDLPIEFRWRNSTPESHIFWRVYSGVKLSYLFYDEYKSVSSNGTVKLSNNKDLNQFQYGIYLAFGWNTWNFSAYYGLNPLFKSSAKIDNQSINMNTINFGLMFYIL
ncbi:porin family protein [Flavobacterium paronense]|uniref:Porin family protein n=1 Tax=Flavobacterium paronense TaxID=1392775 RepID=A0ABV5GE18_9FLAO|nr:porin family protein [Flavobacterium paronense]MDN3678192.1 porin family protein [Flavobacterium paronense]